MVADAELMRRALAQGDTARRRTAPNPWVGAVVVRDGEIVGEGATQPPGGPHAEIEALAGGRRPRPGRHRVHHPRAVLAPRPHSAVRRRAGRSGRHPGRGRAGGPRSAGGGPGHRPAARPRPHRRRRCRRGGRRPFPGALPRAPTTRTRVHRGQDGDEHRRPDRGARRVLAVDHRRGGAGRRALAARRFAGRRRRRRHRAGRSSEPHRARRSAAARRPAAAGAARRHRARAGRRPALRSDARADARRHHRRRARRRAAGLAGRGRQGADRAARRTAVPASTSPPPSSCSPGSGCSRRWWRAAPRSRGRWSTPGSPTVSSPTWRPPCSVATVAPRSTSPAPTASPTRPVGAWST